MTRWNRRQGLRLLAAFLTAGAALGTQALELKPYTPQALQAAQADGKPVALHFHADWCSVCRAQSQVFQGWGGDARLDITVLVVDYDNERPLRRALGVRTQSTLIVYRGVQETARLVGETAPERLRAAFLTALPGAR